MPINKRYFSTVTNSAARSVSRTAPRRRSGELENAVFQEEEARALEDVYWLMKDDYVTCRQNEIEPIGEQLKMPCVTTFSHFATVFDRRYRLHSKSSREHRITQRSAVQCNATPRPRRHRSIRHVLRCPSCSDSFSGPRQSSCFEKSK